MRNIKLIIEYDGTNYAGWQIQSNQRPKGVPSESKGKPVTRNQKRTIQETLEQALSQILQEKVRLTGSGRTDAGVHALGQVANFKTKSKLHCRNIQEALNSVLPDDIRIRQIGDAHPDFHARFSALSKLYRYAIVNDVFVSPRLFRYAHLVRCPLDIRKMRQAAKYFIGQKDLCSFQAIDKRPRSPVRTIKRLLVRKSKNLIELDIEADGFLYRMARNIAGTLIEVGRGRYSPREIKDILKAVNRRYAGPCAPAKGLCLMAVRYRKQKI